MESHFALPFRISDTRASPQTTWSASFHPNYTIVSPLEQPHFQHQLNQHNGHKAPTDFRPIQYQQLVHFDQHHGQQPHFSAAVPLYAHQSYSVQQNYSINSPQGFMAEPLQHDQKLPQPSHILPSQNNSHGPCLACGKVGCQLASHMHFTKHIRNSSKQKLKATSDVDKTPQQSTVSPAMQMQISMGALSQAPMVMEAEQQHLLSLWSVEWSSVKKGPECHLFPTKFIDRVLPAAQTHPPLMQAILAYSGTIHALANHVISDLASRQQALAVQMLSQACPTEAEASTDESILAATFLLLIYLAQGNSAEVYKHVSGLVHLTKIRGGIHYLGLSGLVAEALTYADHMQAIFFNQEPVWQLTLPPLAMGLPPTYGEGFHKSAATQSLDQSLLMVARSVCKVTDIFNHAAINKQIPNDAKYAFSYLSSIADYQLARCNAAYHASSSVNECVVLALILFNQIALHNDGAITPSILQIEYRLWQALGIAEANGLTREIYPCLHMWIVITGLSVASRGSSPFYTVGVDKLRALRMSAAVTSWPQLRKTVLEDFVWLSSTQEDTFRRIWIEVERATPAAGGGKKGAKLPP